MPTEAAASRRRRRWTGARRPRLGAAREVYKGVPAPKRLRVGGDVTEFVKKELPKKLIVLEGDDEATRRAEAKASEGVQGEAEDGGDGRGAKREEEFVGVVSE